MIKIEKYALLCEQIKALIEGETDAVAVMANVVAAIHEAMGFWWTGFYRVMPQVGSDNNELVLGPFQGPVACMHIPFGRGVCGTAWERRQSVVVPDVEQFQVISPVAASRAPRLSCPSSHPPVRWLPCSTSTARTSLPSTTPTASTSRPSVH